MSTSDAAGALLAATAQLSDAVARDDVDGLSDRILQQTLSAVVRAYALKVDRHGEFPAFLPEDGVSATDVAVSAAALLKAANIAVFELAMWVTIKGAA
jgi:hypothetical protein